MAKQARTPSLFQMIIQIHAFSLAAALCLLTGCASYNIGSSQESAPNGSYSGSTLNSPVTDQNPHPGGDQSYPASVSDQGREPAPPDKVDGR
jgi:hypothetical protein